MFVVNYRLLLVLLVSVQVRVSVIVSDDRTIVDKEINLAMNINDQAKRFGRGTIRVCRRGKSILLVALSRLERFNAFNDDGE